MDFHSSNLNNSGKTVNKKRENLKRRQNEVKFFNKPQLILDSHVGKTRIVTMSAPASSQPGYFCEVCDCLIKDSINYLDHVNGQKHQKNMGMSMRVEKSTVSQVRRRIEMNKEKMFKKKEEYNLSERVMALKEEKEAKRRRTKEVKAEKLDQFKTADDAYIASILGFSSFGKKPVNAKDEIEEPDIAKIMGFSNFGKK